MDPTLPSYSDAELPPPELQDEPPAYDCRPYTPPVVVRTEHSYNLSDRKGKPWITLKLQGNGLLSKQIPTFIEGEHITGSVALSLESKDPIQSISISVSKEISSLKLDARIWHCIFIVKESASCFPCP